MSGANCAIFSVRMMIVSDRARTAGWTSRRRIWTYFMQARDRDVRRIRHSSQGSTEHVRCGYLPPPPPAQNAVCCIFLPVILAEISSNIYPVLHLLSKEIVFFMKIPSRKEVNNFGPVARTGFMNLSTDRHEHKK